MRAGTRRLLLLASEAGIPTQRDVYNFYRSDVASAIESVNYTDPPDGHPFRFVYTRTPVGPFLQILTSHVYTDGRSATDLDEFPAPKLKKPPRRGSATADW